MNSSVSKILISILGMTLLLFSIKSALLLPIYPDEVAYKMFLERFFLNGGFKQSVTPFCTDGFLVSPPFLLVPAAIFWTVINNLGDGWLSYRILPLLSVAGIIGFLVSNSIRRGFNIPWHFILLILLGPLIYGLIILRPEIFILLGGLVLFFICRCAINKVGWLRLAALTISLAIVFDLIIYLHPKAIYLILLCIAGIFLYSRSINNIPLRVIYVLSSLTVFMWMTYSAIDLHRMQFLTCPEVPRIELAMSNQSVNLLSALSNPASLGEAFSILTSAQIFKRMVSQVKFKSTYDVGYLPGMLEMNFLKKISKISNLLNIALIILALVYVVIKFTKNLLPSKINIHKNEAYLLLFLCAGFFAPFFLNATKHWYELSFFIGSLTIISSLLWATPSLKAVEHTSNKIFMPWVMMTLGAVILSVYIVSEHFTKSFRENFVGPGISIATDKHQVADQVSKLLAQHNLIHGEPFIVDDLTYDALKNRRVVVPATYLYIIGDNPILLQKTFVSHDIRYGMISCSLYYQIESAFGAKLISSVPLIDPSNHICFFKVIPD